MANEIIPKDTIFYGIKTKHLKKVENNSQWTHFLTFLHSSFIDHINKNDLLKKIAAVKHIEKFKDSKFYSFFKHHCYDDDLVNWKENFGDENHIFYNLLCYCNKVRFKSDHEIINETDITDVTDAKADDEYTISTLLHLMSNIYISLDDVINTTPIKIISPTDKMNEALNKYPILKTLIKKYSYLGLDKKDFEEISNVIRLYDKDAI